MVANCMLLRERDNSVETCRLSKALFERLRIRPEVCLHTSVRFLNECAKLSDNLRLPGKFEVLF